ncbi:hypothetical protein sscle_11g082660 [Sclerotinia sclerotiorum 1980 UF-70]|uniref:Uncharacterized protein n=1 Tax=Sclerotinia sclerotiorum (strain ATCC 18683 / 1980 / Ss-1) TaxID=665079 RepID=A0A1D9QEW6_SCLS1|nr:hypothetical protein sscle_11g082660 [Sclerotinia sclerotiorum 1980 UF-70]
MGPRPSACHICGSGSSCCCHRPLYWDRTHPEPPNFSAPPVAEGVEPSPTDEFNELRIPRGAISAHLTSQQSSPFTDTPPKSRSSAAPTSDSSPATSNNSFGSLAYSASPFDSNNYFPTKTPRSSPVNSKSIGNQFRTLEPLPLVDNTSRLWAPKALRVTQNIAQTWTNSEAFTKNSAANNSQQSRKRTVTEASHYDNEEERYHKKR